MKFQLIDAEKATHTVKRLCGLLEVSRSGFYAWKARRRAGPSRRRQADSQLLNSIVAIHAESRRLYGSPRVHQALRAGPTEILCN